jgi:hypothetical protein
MLCTARSPMPTSLAISASRTSEFWAMHTSTWAWLVRNVHEGYMLSRIEARYPWCHIELLQHFDGQPGYTKAQGEG